MIFILNILKHGINVKSFQNPKQKSGSEKKIFYIKIYILKI